MYSHSPEPEHRFRSANDLSVFVANWSDWIRFERTEHLASPFGVQDADVEDCGVLRVPVEGRAKIGVEDNVD